MLKTIILSTVSLAALTGVAAAADLPSRMAPAPLYAAPLPTFTWTGGYFGINAGYAFDHEGRFKSIETPGLPQTKASLNSDGFTGGGQVGYNYQFNQFGSGGGIVVGVEADIAYTDLSSNGSVTYPTGGQSFNGLTANYKSGLDYLGTVRGRVGYAFNQFLIYGTGGFAFGGVDNRVSVSFPVTGAASFAAGRTDDTETGYAYGGGVEYALPTASFLNFFKSSAVTLKAEYLHYDLGTSHIAVNTTGGVNVANTKVSNDGDLARVGLNYKFGSY